MPKAFLNCCGRTWTVHELQNSQKAQPYIGRLIGTCLPEKGYADGVAHISVMAFQLGNEPVAGRTDLYIGFGDVIAGFTAK